MFLGLLKLFAGQTRFANRDVSAITPHRSNLEFPFINLEPWQLGDSKIDVGSQGSLKNLRSHIDASHSRQPLVKGERLVRYEVNAVMSDHGSFSYMPSLLRLC